MDIILSKCVHIFQKIVVFQSIEIVRLRVANNHRLQDLAEANFDREAVNRVIES